MPEIRVELGEKSYPIFISSDCLSSIGERLRSITTTQKVAVVTDPKLKINYCDNILDLLRSADFDPICVEIPAGDANKSLESFAKIQTALIDHQMDRNSIAIALGGGVIGDLTGFAAATFMRGIDWIQIPTTLLAQVDASIGGKTAINHPKAKNLIGAFHQPKFVLIDVDTLKTLPPRELRAGLVEVIKHGVIMDKSLFTFVENNLTKITNLDREAMIEIITRSCRDKGFVVENDEKENGLRSTLNYGHTFGHAIENLSNYDLLHGEAISIGMNCAAQLSVNLGLLSCEDRDRQNELLIRSGLPILVPKSIDPKQILDTMYLDKKTTSGELKLILISAIGKVESVSDVRDDEILEAIRNCTKNSI